MMKTKVIVGAALGALAVLASGSWAARRASAKTSLVSQGPVRESIVASGVVVPKRGVADVRARAEGRVTRVLVREGDHVDAGQLLAEIDGAEMKAQVVRLEAERRAFGTSAVSVAKGARVEERTAADAELHAAEQSLAIAQDRAARIEKLRASGSESDQAEFEAHGALGIARAQVEQTKARRDLLAAGGRAEDVSIARDRVAQADAALDEAQQRLQRTRIVAPIAGVILARRIDEGDTVESSFGTAPNLFEIADPSQTELAIEIEDPDATRVETGLAVTVTTPGGRTVLAHGQIARVGARLGKRTIGADDARLRAESMVRAAWVTLAQDGAPLLPIGKRVEAVVQLPEREVTARVPRAAVIVRDGHATVDVPWGPMYSPRAVTLGVADDAFVEVSGVQPGTRVVLAGK